MCPGNIASTQRFEHNLSDELIRAEKCQDSAPNTPIDSENWSLDAAGNWLSHSRGSGAVMETRTHNSMNRLTAIGGSGSTVIEGSVNEFARVSVNGASAQLSKDPVGDGFRYRRTVPVTPGSNTVTVSATDTGGATTTKQWQFNVPATSRSFSYDANGNTLSDGQRTMTWDVKNRLRTVTKGGTTWKWDYDHQDRRVKEYSYPAGTTSGTAFTTPTKIFIWSGTEVVQERNAANTITRTHYTGGFSDGATPASGTKFQTLTDHLGHVREIVDANGTIVTRYDYTSYQGPLPPTKAPGTNVEATFQTIGRYYHHAGSGLELALYRAYDPELGKWLNEDPIGERGGLNLYGYVGNSPLMMFDPLGLASFMMPNGWQNDPCDKKLQLIKDIIDHVKNRWLDMFNDHNFLYQNPNPPSGKGTWAGHQQMFKQSQKQLRDVLNDFAKGGCGDKLKLPDNAWKAASMPAPTMPHWAHHQQQIQEQGQAMMIGLGIGVGVGVAVGAAAVSPAATATVGGAAALAR